MFEVDFDAGIKIGVKWRKSGGNGLKRKMEKRLLGAREMGLTKRESLVS